MRTIKRNLRRQVIAAAVVAALGAGSTQAATPVTWIGPASGGFWDIAGNWNPALPGATNDVLLGTSDTVFRSGNVTVLSFTGTGLLTVSGGILSNTQTSSIGSLLLSGGTLGGAGDLGVVGAATWTSGTITGAGITTFGDALAISGIASKTISGGRTINAGNTTWSGNTANNNNAISIANASVFNNTGTFTDSNTFDSSLAVGGGGGTFNNNGTFNKQSNTTTSVSVIFNNAGIVNVNAGLFLPGGGGTSTGVFNIAAGATLEFRNGTHILNNATTSGLGTLQISTDNVGADALVTVNGGTHTSTFLLSGSTLNGTDNVFQGAATWTGGTITGAASTTFGSTLAISGANSKNITGGRTINASSTTWSGNTVNNNNGIAISGASVFNNTGTFTDSNTFDSSISVGNGGGTFNNNGTFNKQSNTTTSITTLFNTTDTVDVNAGTLLLGGGGTDTGVFNIAAGATLEYRNGNHTLNNVTTSGLGTLQISTDNVGADALVTINGGTHTTAVLFSGSTLTGTDHIFQGPVTWTGGTITGAGSTTFNNAVTTISGPGTKSVVNTRILNLTGTTTWSGNTADNNNVIAISGAGVINNNGTFNDANTFASFISVGNGGGTFNNNGIFNKQSNTITTTTTLFNSTNTVNVNAGTFRPGGGTSTGVFNIANGATLEFINGSSTLNNVTTSGLGLLKISTDNVGGDALVTINGGTHTTPVLLSGSVLTGTDHTFQGPATWSGTTITGAGSTTFANDVAITDTTTTKNLANGRVLNFQGTTTWSGNTSSNNNVIQFTNLATLNNNGTFNDANAFDSFISHNVGGGIFNNNGTYNKQVNTITTVDLGIQFNNSGTININAGTMLFIGGTAGPTGTVQVASGATFQQAAASTVGNLITAGTLAVADRTLTVNIDYNNANFGTGNTFNRRANVTVTGAGNRIIAAGDANQGVSGVGVSNGTTNTPTLTIGNVRVGGTTFTYNINNTGSTGPSLRGAIQTNVNGGNITDSRLSGSGVTAGNWGPIATGGSLSRDVTVTVATAGNFTVNAGQTVNILNNFDNTRSQVLTISSAAGATAFNAAAGTAIPTPVALANQRVGGSANQALTITNTAVAGPFSEDLNASFGTSTGAASGTGSISGRLAGTNNTGSGTMSVAVNTTTAGAKTGSVTVNYQTAGAVNGVSNGLGTASAGNQVINVSGNVYQIAQANPASLPTPVNLGNFRAGAGAQSQTINITNTSAGAPVGFQEGLAANIGTITGSATGTGFANAAVGTSGALQVGLSGIAAGINSGTVQVQLQSNGITTTGPTGLTALNLGSAQIITINAAGYNLAAGEIQTPALNFGNVQVGQSVSQVLTIRNAGTGPAGFVEDLNASFGASSGTNGSFISGTGAVNNLTAGNTSTAMTVNVNTSNAGAVSGAIAVNFASTGAVNNVSNGLGTTSLGAVNYDVTGTITGNVINTAQPVINGVANPNPINVNLGNVRINTAASQNLSVLNQSSGAPQQGALNASIASNGAPVTASGSFNGLTPGNTSSALNVGIDTTAAGVRSGSASVSLVSDITAFGNCAPACTLSLPNQTVNVTGAVYNLANPMLNTPSVTLFARQGNASPSQVVSVTNQSADAFREGLNASISTNAAGFSATGSVTNLAAQANSGNALNVALNTASAGSFSGNAILALASNGSLTNNSNVALGSQSVDLIGRVYTSATAAVQSSVNFGIVHVGDVLATRAVSVQNSAPATALNDTLNASIGGATGPFTSNNGSVSGLTAGGAANTTGLAVGLNTNTAGVYSGSATVGLASHNPDMSDLALASANVTLDAQVNNFANAVFREVSGAGTLSRNGNQFTLDFGSVVQGAGALSAVLDVQNLVSGPADLLNGSLNVVDGNDFTTLLKGLFTDVAAGGSSGDLLQFLLNTAMLGSFTDTIDLTWHGHNASGYVGPDSNYSLVVAGTVVARATSVPEPNSLALLALGFLLLIGAAARPYSKRRRA